MEAVGRSGRIGLVLGALASLALAVALWEDRPAPRPPPTSHARVGHDAARAQPALDLDRLYALEHLVLEVAPRFEPHALAPVGAGPAEPAVPEPGAATLWILGLAALYTLYLPARSW